MSNRHSILVSVQILFSFIALTPHAHAQDSTAALERQLKLDGNRLWVVKKGSLQNFTGNADSVVADYDNEADAQKTAQSLNAALKGSDEFRWLYTYVKRLQAQPDAVLPLGVGRGIPIVKPNLKSAASGPLQTNEKSPLSINGKCGEGRIGTATVKMCFREKGELEITGDLAGKGKWEQSGSGVTLSTKVSTYRGSIEGTKVAGVRFVRDNSQPLTEWSIELTPVDLKIQPSAHSNDIDVIGEWRFRFSNNRLGPTRFNLYADGRADSGKNYQGITFDSGTWRWVEAKEIQIDLHFVDPKNGTNYGTPSPKTISIIVKSPTEAVDQISSDIMYSKNPRL